MTDIPPVDMQAIRARLEKATKGPWHQGPYYRSDVESRFGRVCACGSLGAPQACADAEFITHAPTDVAALLTELEQARAQVAHLTAREAQIKALADEQIGLWVDEARLLRAMRGVDNHRKADAVEQCAAELRSIQRVILATPAGVQPTPQEPRGPMVVGTWPERCVQRAFVEGAQWWEFTEKGATMWQSDRDKAEAAAVERYGQPTQEPK